MPGRVLNLPTWATSTVLRIQTTGYPLASQDDLRQCGNQRRSKIRSLADDALHSIDNVRPGYRVGRQTTQCTVSLEALWISKHTLPHPHISWKKAETNQKSQDCLLVYHFGQFTPIRPLQNCWLPQDLTTGRNRRKCEQWTGIPRLPPREDVCFQVYLKYHWIVSFFKTTSQSSFPFRNRANTVHFSMPC